MRIRISEGDISLCALQGVDIHRFLRHLASRDAIGKDDNGLPLPNPFDEVHIGTTWGLLVFTLYAHQGQVTKAFNVDLLMVTRDIVISNDGTFVDRYESIVDELLLQARGQLLTGKPKPSLILKGKLPPVYAVKSND